MLTFSAYGATKTYTSALYVGFASSSVGTMFIGSSNAIYGQPAATTSALRLDNSDRAEAAASREGM